MSFYLVFPRILKENDVFTFLEFRLFKNSRLQQAKVILPQTDDYKFVNIVIFIFFFSSIHICFISFCFFLFCLEFIVFFSFNLYEFLHYSFHFFLLSFIFHLFLYKILVLIKNKLIFACIYISFFFFH